MKWESKELYISFLIIKQFVWIGQSCSPTYSVAKHVGASSTKKEKKQANSNQCSGRGGQ